MASPNKGFLQLLTEWLSGLLSNALGGALPHISSVGGSDDGSNGKPTAGGPPEPSTGNAGSTPVTRVVENGTITARFMDNNSTAWAKQFPNTPMAGRHGGLDISAPQGSRVWAPYAMQIVAIGHYDDRDNSGEPCCRYGSYVIGYLNSDPTLQYYSGHLQNVKIKNGQNVTAGTQIGETNIFRHSHIQMKRGATLVNPEVYFSTH
jgi:murein DD-endopeptidase MepM/ murein hydrolase activator NlpD